MWYAIVAILILIADQGLKYWVTLNIPLDTGHVTLIPGVLELTNIHNNGAAFSILQHAPHWIFVIFTLVFAAIAVFCLRCKSTCRCPSSVRRRIGNTAE